MISKLLPLAGNAEYYVASAVGAVVVCIAARDLEPIFRKCVGQIATEASAVVWNCMFDSAAVAEFLP